MCWKESWIQLQWRRTRIYYHLRLSSTVLHENFGNILDIITFPIHEVKYGNLENEQQLSKIEVGWVNSCEGRNEVKPEELCESCRNLKHNGDSAIRIYVINDGTVSFYDLQNSIDDPTVEQEMPWRSFYDVMFVEMIYRTTEYYISSGAISFESTSIDLVNNFSISIGVNQDRASIYWWSTEPIHLLMEVLPGYC